MPLHCYENKLRNRFGGCLINHGFQLERNNLNGFVYLFQESGLSKWVGTQLAHLDAIPSFAIVICVCIMITTFTEFTSNVATATIFLPILASLVSFSDVGRLLLEFVVLAKCQNVAPSMRVGWGEVVGREIKANAKTLTFETVVALHTRLLVGSETTRLYHQKRDGKREASDACLLAALGVCENL